VPHFDDENIVLIEEDDGRATGPGMIRNSEGEQKF